MTNAHPALRWNDVFGRFDRMTVKRHRLFGDLEVHDHDYIVWASHENGFVNA